MKHISLVDELNIYPPLIIEKKWKLNHLQVSFENFIENIINKQLLQSLWENNCLQLSLQLGFNCNFELQQPFAIHYISTTSMLLNEL
jgi:hypothetical protein